MIVIPHALYESKSHKVPLQSPCIKIGFPGEWSLSCHKAKIGIADSRVCQWRAEMGGKCLREYALADP